jgi:hypothetical protein
MASSFSADPLFIDGEMTPALLRLSWRGSSRDRQPQRLLGPFLTEQIEQAQRAGCPVEMRFDRLEYFNSATVMAIVGAVRGAKAKGIAVRIVYDGSRDWQRLSFEPMRVFAQGGGLELVALEPGSAKGGLS